MAPTSRGRNALLHFEGLPVLVVQTAEIKRSIDITSMDVTVLPILTNTREQCRAKWRRAGAGGSA